MAQVFGIKTKEVTASFDKGLIYLMNEGCKLISLEDAARLRVKYGINSDFCRKMLIVREGFVSIPGVGDYLTKKSPIIMRAKQATARHKNEEEFYPHDYLSKEQIRRILDEDSGNAIQILEENISTARFENSELAVFAFGDFAGEYGDFLRRNGVDEIAVFVPGQTSRMFARQVTLAKINNSYDSAIDCDRRELHLPTKMYGVVSSD